MVDGSSRVRTRAGRRIALALLVLLAAAPRARAGLADEHRAARADTVERLEELGRWCGAQRLFARRAAVARHLLTFDPDHGTARTWLRQRQDADGVWRRRPGAPEPSDLDPDALGSYPATRARLLGPAVERLEAIVRRYRGALDPARLRPVQLDLIEIAPDETRYRAWLGEVWKDGRWVLAEAVEAGDRRRALLALSRRLEARTRPVTDADTAPVRPAYESGIAWRHGARCGDARVLGQVGRMEVRDTARLLDLAARFVSAVLRRPTRLGDGTTVYLFPDRESAHALLLRHPLVPRTERLAALAAPSHAIPMTFEMLVHHERRRVRTDRAVEQAIGSLLETEFRIPREQGWLGRGLRLRLVQDVIGSPPTWFPPGTWTGGRDRTLLVRMTSAAADWRRLARDVFESEEPVRLERLSTLEPESWAARDALAAYGLATYLLEGRPDELATVLERAADGKSPERELRLALGLRDAEIVDRARRFLVETTPLFPGAELDVLEIEPE